MAAIFPPADRGGVPPGPNVVNGFAPEHSVIGDGPYYVAPTCSTLLTDGQMNALTSEVLAAVDELGFAYNTSRVDNLGQALGGSFAHVETDIAAKVDRSGDTMQGELVLAADPVLSMEATTKQYVDAKNAALDQTLRNEIASEIAPIVVNTQTAIADLEARKVNRSGDIMLGRLTLNAPPIYDLDAANKAYVDALALEGGHFVDGPHDGLSWARNNGGWDGVVSVDTDQTALLTPTQQATARTNIGIVPSSVGQYIESIVPESAPIPQTTNIASNITSITLPPGDWDVTGTVATTTGSQTVTAILTGWTSALSTTTPDRVNNGGYTQLSEGGVTGAANAIPIGAHRFSVTTNTVVYLSMNSMFSGGTLSAFGIIRARRWA